MAIPGMNLLALANKAIATQTVCYTPYLTRTANSLGVWNTTYAAPCNIQANIQPVPRNRYENMGLDFQKNYVTVFIQKNVIDIDRNVTGDQFTVGGKIFEAISKTNWFYQDGWDSVLCVQVPS